MIPNRKQSGFDLQVPPDTAISPRWKPYLIQACRRDSGLLCLLVVRTDFPRNTKALSWWSSSIPHLEKLEPACISSWVWDLRDDKELPYNSPLSPRAALESPSLWRLCRIWASQISQVSLEYYHIEIRQTGDVLQREAISPLASGYLVTHKFNVLVENQSYRKFYGWIWADI